MRSDFTSIFNPPARTGRDDHHYKRASGDLESLPSFEGNRVRRSRRWKYNSRHHWAALKRWLKSRAGNPWDQVWSEICSANDSRDNVSWKTREYILRFVEMNVRVDDEGTVWDSRGYYRVHGAYVDLDGVLRYLDRKRHRYGRRDNPDIVRINKLRQFERMNGIWFDVLYLDPQSSSCIIRRSDFGYMEIDWLLHSDVLEENGHRYNRISDGRFLSGTVFAYAKRSLSSAELKEHGLENDPDGLPVMKRKKTPPHDRKRA